MEKRSRRRTRDLVTQAASQGLSENEIGCARISMMARSINAPCKGRIQMRKTKPLHFFTFGLQRTAGPYSWVIGGHRPAGISEARGRPALRDDGGKTAQISQGRHRFRRADGKGLGQHPSLDLP